MKWMPCLGECWTEGWCSAPVSGGTAQHKWDAEIGRGSSFTHRSRQQSPGVSQFLRQRLVLEEGAVLGQGCSFIWGAEEKASKGIFLVSVTFLHCSQELVAPLQWSSWIYKHDGLLTGHKSPWQSLLGPHQLIHWGALIKARIVWGPLSPLSPAHRPITQQWALGFWTGLLSTTQTLWEYVAGVKALTADMFLFVSHRNSVAPTTPWALPSLWWTSSVSASPTMACEVCGLCLGSDFAIPRSLYKLDWCFWAVLCVVSAVFQS